MLAVGVQSYLEFKLFQERCSCLYMCTCACSIHVLVSPGMQLKHTGQQRKAQTRHFKFALGPVQHWQKAKPASESQGVCHSCRVGTDQASLKTVWRLQLSVHWRQVDKCTRLTCSGVQRPKLEPHGQATPHQVPDAAWQQPAGQPFPTGTQGGSTIALANTHTNIKM